VTHEDIQGASTGGARRSAGDGAVIAIRAGATIVQKLALSFSMPMEYCRSFRAATVRERI